VKSFLGRVRDDQSLSTITPGVHVLNAHVGKGQQFDWVVVMGLEEGHVPDFRARSTEEITEGRCVLLVMLSRARKGIFVTRATRVTDQYGRSHAKDPSRWWTLIAEACRPNDEPLKAVLSAGRTRVADGVEVPLPALGRLLARPAR
jgi:DNA helicase-2/ATP-dependent DNA helicase PcrA